MVFSKVLFSHQLNELSEQNVANLAKGSQVISKSRFALNLILPESANSHYNYLLKECCKELINNSASNIGPCVMIRRNIQVIFFKNT